MKSAKDWGWREFITLQALFDADAGHLLNDDCVFAAEVLMLRESSEAHQVRLSPFVAPFSEFFFVNRMLSLWCNDKQMRLSLVSPGVYMCSMMCLVATHWHIWPAAEYVTVSEHDAAHCKDQQIEPIADAGV